MGWACVARCDDRSCAPWEGGRAGAGPQAFAFPTASPTCPRPHRGPWILGKMSPRAAGPQGVVGQALGGQTGWLPQALQPRSPCTWVDPRDQGPKEQAWADVLRFQGAISGAGGRAAVHGAAHPSPAAPAESPMLETSVSVSVSAPGRQHRPQPLPGPGHSLPLAGVQRPRPSCASVLTGGARSLHDQALGVGVGGTGRAPPSLCPTLALTRPALIGHPFLLSFNVSIPAFEMGRKVP